MFKGIIPKTIAWEDVKKEIFEMMEAERMPSLETKPYIYINMDIRNTWAAENALTYRGAAWSSEARKAICAGAIVNFGTANMGKPDNYQMARGSVPTFVSSTESCEYSVIDEMGAGVRGVDIGELEYGLGVKV